MIRDHIFRAQHAHDTSYLDLTRRRRTGRLLASTVLAIAATTVLLASIRALAVARPEAAPTGTAHATPVTQQAPAPAQGRPATTTQGTSHPPQPAGPAAGPTHAAGTSTAPASTIDTLRRATFMVAEDCRISAIRATTAIVSPHSTIWTAPYRVHSGGTDTLVLTRAGRPYTVVDLLRLAPHTFVRQADGGYLLSEDIYLGQGATLRLSMAGGLTVRLASTHDRFVSIVAGGGTLVVTGTRLAPTTITSWNPATSKPDQDVTDGRAYLRAIGGKLLLANAIARDLGF